MLHGLDSGSHDALFVLYEEVSLQGATYAFFPAAHQRSLRPLPHALVRSALSTALGAALLTSLYGARGCRYELRRSYFAESDAHQVAFSTALVSFDLGVVLATLRRAPFAAFPFVVWNVLS